MESFISSAGSGVGSRHFACFLLLGMLWVSESYNPYNKECTNIYTSLPTNTLNGELATTEDAARKAELAAHLHLTPTDDAAWLDLHPEKKNQQLSPKQALDWAMLYRTLKGGSTGTGGRVILEGVPLEDVRLDPTSMQGRAMQTNLEYLLMLDVDRLVWSFRRTAGLPHPGAPFGGWEGSTVELRGHFVGHYMSATALLWVSTRNGTIYKRMTEVVDVLYKCQKKMGTGYLSAFPTEQFDRLEAIQTVWAPYYTIHKIMAGLLDQHTFAKNKKALNMVIWMAEYFSNRVANVIQTYSIERHWMSLNDESGGMNDVLYRLYSITGNQKHLVLAHLFDKPCFLGFLALKTDSLSGFHVNTNVPLVVGTQRRYEVTGDPLYKEMGIYFMDIVNSSHAYATGGTSHDEHWTEPKRLMDTLDDRNEETCTTYNMLKISRNLFRWTKEIAYADYYERALTNGILSVQRGTDPGVMIYLLPLGAGQTKAISPQKWGTKFDTFWCCYGTGVESFSKLGDSIYFEEKGSTPGLYIIQFVSSYLNWKKGGIMLNMKVNDIISHDPFLRATLSVSHAEKTSTVSTINLRIPSWTSLHGAKVTLNSQNVELPGPGNYLSITRQWAANDILTIQFPMFLKTEHIKDDRPEYEAIQAILFGPYLLAGLTTGDWDLKNTESISELVTAVPSAHNSQLITLYQEDVHLVLSTNHSSNQSVPVSMIRWPRDGNNSAVSATFRLVTGGSEKLVDAHRGRLTEQAVLLEPFDSPGMAITDHGPDMNLTVSFGTEPNFRMVQALNKKKNSVSFESFAHPGCYVHGGPRAVQLLCRHQQSKRDRSFKDAASFVVEKPRRKYHPISFAAKGVRKNFLLEPLLNMRDETYTVYFDFGWKGYVKEHQA